MWWVEEGGPRVGAKRRGGDPLPQCQAQSQIPPASGQQGVRLGVRLINEHPNEHPRRTPPTPKRTPPAGHPTPARAGHLRSHEPLRSRSLSFAEVIGPSPAEIRAEPRWRAARTALWRYLPVTMLARPLGQRLPAGHHKRGQCLLRPCGRLALPSCAPRLDHAREHFQPLRTLPLRSVHSGLERTRPRLIEAHASPAGSGELFS